MNVRVWIRTMVALAASLTMSISMGSLAFAQDDVDACFDRCADSEDACVERCQDEACEDACADAADLCSDQCE